MKILVVYYSYTENNQKLAYQISNLIKCDLLKIEEVKKRTSLTILMDLMFNRKPSIKLHPVQLIDYDHIILAAPIWAGKLATPLKTFLLNEKSNIQEYSFITVRGGGQGQKEKIQKELATFIAKDPLKVAELSINDLLPVNQKDTMKYTSTYQIKEQDFKVFGDQIQRFLGDINLKSY